MRRLFRVEVWFPDSLSALPAAVAQFKNLAFYGFRTAKDHGRVPPDLLECGGNLTPMLTGTYSARHKRGGGQVAQSCRRFGFGEVSVPGQGVAARGKRRRRGAGGI